MKAIVEDDRRKKRALERARKDAAAAGKRKRKEDAGDKGSSGSVFTDADFEVGGLKLENFRHEYVGNKDCRVSLN